MLFHDDVIRWKHFPHYWPFVWGIHRSPMNSPHKGQRRGALMFSFICARINVWINNREAGDLRCHRAHYDVIVMSVFLLVAVEWRKDKLLSNMHNCVLIKRSIHKIFKQSNPILFCSIVWTIYPFPQNQYILPVDGLILVEQNNPSKG